METHSTTSPAPVKIEANGELTTPETPRVFDARNAFDLDELAKLRAEQKDVYTQSLQRNLKEGMPDQDVTLFANFEVSKKIDDYLNKNGLTREDDNFFNYKGALLNLSITAVPENEWTAKFDDKEGKVQGMSGRDKARNYYEVLTKKSFYGDQPLEDTPEVTEDGESPLAVKSKVDVLSETQKSLEDRRSELAALSAKRQGNIFGKSEKYDDALVAYNEEVVKLGKLETKAILEDDTLSETEKNAKVIEYLFAEQNKLREVSMESLANSKVSKFIKGFSDFMNRGSKTERIAKGVIIGVGIGAFVTASAGLGAGAVVVAGAAAAGARFSRSFAMQEAKAGRGIGQLDESAKNKAEKALEDYEPTHEDATFDVIQKSFNTGFETDIKGEQKKRRKSTIKAVGMVAAGAALGTVINIAADNGIFEGAGGHIANVQAEPSIGSQGGGIHTPDGDSGGGYNRVDVPAETPAVVPEVIQPDPNFYIEPGEGGISLFQDLGLNESDWYAVHQDLLQQFPNDFYGDGGDVRISHSGQLSVEAQQFIKARFGL